MRNRVSIGSIALHEIEDHANRIPNEVGRKVRKTIHELGGTMPENLPVAWNVMKVARWGEKRLKSSQQNQTTTMNAPKNELLHAIELALAGKWEAAHEIVQQYEADATAAWIHAVLHKMEGDLGNARYWYRRADQMSHVADESRAELGAIKAELATDEHG